MNDTNSGPADSPGITYTGAFTPVENGWIHAQALELPEAVSQGRTLEEAKTNLADAIEMIVALRSEQGLPILQSGQTTIEPVTVAAPPSHP